MENENKTQEELDNQKQILDQETPENVYDIREPDDDDDDTAGDEDAAKADGKDAGEGGEDGKDKGKASGEKSKGDDDGESSVLPLWQQRRAARLGIDKDRIGRLAQAGLLDDYMDDMEAAMSARQRTETTEKPDTQGKGGANQDKADDNPTEFQGIKLPENMKEEYEESFVTMMDGIVGQFNDRLKQIQESLQGTLTQTQQASQQQAVREAEQIFDDSLNSFINQNEDFKDTFGLGTVDEIDHKTDQFKNRQALWEEMATIESGRAARNLQPLPPKELLKKAVNALFAEQTQNIERRKLAQKASGRQSQHLNRPSKRTGKPLSREERAIAAANAAYEEKGLQVSGLEDGDEF